MNFTKYRIPDTDLYLRADGIFSPTVEPGETVLDLTPDILEVAYHGRTLQRLTVLADSAGEGYFGGQKQDSYSQLGIQAIKTVPYGKEAMEFVSILNAMTVPGKPDPIMESLNRVHETLKQIQDFNLAAWVTSREDNLAFLIAHSSAALHTASTFVQNNGSRTDPVWAAKIAIAERDSLLAVLTFTRNMEGGYWLRPYSVPAISWAGNPTDYWYGWMPHMPDRAEVNSYSQVWDYRWALPVLVYAIVARLLVLTAVGTGSRQEQILLCAEIKGYVGFLQAVFKKRWGGLRTLTQLSDQQLTNLRQMGRFPMAAVDIYGGDYIGGIYFMTGSWYPFSPPSLAPPWLNAKSPAPLSEAEVEFNMKAFATHWWNLLYLRTGLEDLLLFICELQAICDEPWFAHTFADVHESVSQIRSDNEKRRMALLAAGLSSLSRTEDTAAGAAQTHVLYEALRAGGDRAKEIVAACVRDLTHLPVAREPKAKKAQPARVTTAAAKRRKRKDA